MTAGRLLATSPDRVLEDALWYLKANHVRNDSRNGVVLQAPGPVITEYVNPRRRVMFSPLRDANPFFHMVEALWMLAGRNDVAKVSNYAKQMEAFADDGLQWGAYGFRWRHFFGFDQLLEIIERLTEDPKTRRAVLTMWSPSGDLVAADGGAGGFNSKDVPCNTQVYFDGTKGTLDMTVTNRSNDIIWGAYGANLVHMSFLHEFVAAAVNMPLGRYYQFSNNFHLYAERPDVQRLFSAAPEGDWRVHFEPDLRYDRLDGRRVDPKPILMEGEQWEAWLEDCELLMGDSGVQRAHLTTVWMRKVAWPMIQAHRAYKEGDNDQALDYAALVNATDWSAAGFEWLARRISAAKMKEKA